LREMRAAQAADYAAHGAYDVVRAVIDD
jgi:hypothetical protein